MWILKLIKKFKKNLKKKEEKKCGVVVVVSV